MVALIIAAMNAPQKLRHAYVVDDHKPNRDSLGLLLLLQGWSVTDVIHKP